MHLGWFDTHPVVSFLIISLCGVITLTTLVWTVRTFLKDVKEETSKRDEERREYKLFRHRMRSTILQAKEWDIDATPLIEAVNQTDLARKAGRMMEHEKLLMVLPIIPLMLFIFIGTVGAFWSIFATGVCFVLSIPWWIYHGRRWYLLYLYCTSLPASRGQ